MPVREILYRFTTDISEVRSAFSQLDSLWQSSRSKQQADRDAELKALDDYASKVKSLVDQIGSMGTGANAKGTRAPGSSGGVTRAPAAMAPEWQAATTKLRADIAQEAAGTAQVAAERQRIIGLIDTEINALKVKADLTMKERAELQKATLERERQSDAMKTGRKIGVTAGTREALSGIGGSILGLGQAAVGGQAGSMLGDVGSAVIGGLSGAGLVVGIQMAVEALSKFVAKVRELAEESDKVSNIKGAFESLSSGIGTAPAEFIDKLRTATHGLVGDTQLMTEANHLMLQGLTLTQPQITEFIGKITELSLRTGGDATASFEAVTRALATGRPGRMAYMLDLNDIQKRQLEHASTLTDSERITAEYSIVLEAANSKLKQMGNYVETSGTKAKQADVSFGNFLDDLSEMAGKSVTVTNMADAWHDVVNWLDKAVKGQNEYLNKAQSYKAAGDAALKSGPYGYDKVRSINTPPPSPATPGLPSDSILTAGYKSSQTPKLRDFDLEKKQAEEAAAIEEQHIQQRLDVVKDGINVERTLQKQAYDNGLIDLKDYIEQEKTLLGEEAAADIESIQEQARQKKVGLQNDMKRLLALPAAGGMGMTKDSKSYQELVSQSDAADQAMNTQIIERAQKLGQDRLNLSMQESEDELNAKRTATETEFDIVKAGFDRQSMAREDSFKIGAMDAQDYLTQRKQQIEQEYQATKSFNQREYEDKGQSAQAAAELDKANVAADMKRQQALLQLHLETFDKIDQAQQQSAERTQSVLQARLSTAQARGSKAPGALGLPTGEEVSIVQQLVSATEQEMAANQKELETLKDQPALYAEVQKRIETNRQALIQYNEELAKSTEMLSTQGGFLSNIGKALGVLTGPGGQRLSSGFGAIGGMLSTIGGFALAANQTTARSGGNASFMSFLPGIGGSGDITTPTSLRGGGTSGGGLTQLASPTQTLAGKFQNLSAQIDKMVSSAAGFVQVLQGRGGVVGGALSGGAMGMQAGQSVAGMASMTGPAAAAMGAAVGAIGALVGVFSAKAREQTQQLAQTITDSFNNVTQSLSIGTTNLNQAIQQTEAIRQQSIDQLSGQKGGQDQLNQMLPQFNQTIAQLQAQQAQIFETMDQSTELMSAPQPFQQYLQNIQQIIQAYQQYVAAGGDVNEANQNMSESFSALLTTSTQQLLSNQQGAIQNAINVQDLQLQQQQQVLQQQQLALNQQMAAIQYQILVFNTNAQIAGIMAQGNVTRQAPTAMTKGLQVAEVEMNFQLQQQQYQLQQQGFALQSQQLTAQAQSLQEQMSVAQYQLQVQTQIFGLASTRVGLEMELADTQNAQFTLQQNQTDALAALVSMLQSGNFGNITSAILSGSTTAAAMMAGLAAAMQSLGLTPGMTGLSATTTQTISQLLAGIPGLNAPLTTTGIFGGTVTAPAQNPQPAGGIPSFDVGGTVPADMLAMVHQGEVVTPASDVAGQAAASAQRALTENSILSTAQMRLQIEMQIHQMRMDELNAMNGSGSSETSMLLGTYNTRGRQGFSSFYGELG